LEALKSEMKQERDLIFTNGENFVRLLQNYTWLFGAAKATFTKSQFDRCRSGEKTQTILHRSEGRHEKYEDRHRESTK